MPVNDPVQRWLAAVSAATRHHAIQKCLLNSKTCSATVIKAHSIQSGVLKNIAQNGHVYMFNSWNISGPKLTRCGVNRATTFTGFCQTHDADMFKSVDFTARRVFDPTNTEQHVLLSLRAAAREYWLKLNNQKLFEFFGECARKGDLSQIERITGIRGRDLHPYIGRLNEIAPAFLKGTKSSLSRLQRLYTSLAVQVRQKRFHLSRARIYELPVVAEVAVASCMNPEYDFAGARISSLRLDAEVIDVVLNVMPMEGRTWVLFLYHRKFTDRVRPLFDQLDGFSGPAQSVAFSKMILIHCENVAFSPSYIESVPDRDKETMEQVFRQTVQSACPYDEVPDFNFFQNRNRSDRSS